MPDTLTDPKTTAALDQTPPPAAISPTADQADDLGLDRAFVMSMARIPLYALGWAAASVVLWKILAAAAPSLPPCTAPVVLICIGMILAAVIDGWAFKVPNWLTLALVMSGWYLGLLHDFGLASDGIGGIGSALAGTALGWVLLFPALFIGGMGQGDVKMQMGFGSWIGATFGFGNYSNTPFESVGGAGDAAKIILCAFALGVIIGGVFGIVMMALRRQFHKNVQNAKDILVDLQVMMTMGPKVAADRANSRRKDWVRLPYGVPLCVGLLGYLAYHFGLFGGI